MPLTDHVAIVSLTDRIEMRDVLRAAAAVQKQITRDFTPFWGLPATVDVFADLESVPSDYHPVILFGDAEELGGKLDVAIGADEAAAADRRLRARPDVRAAPQRLHAPAVRPRRGRGHWSVVLSHEVLEMIADPYGNRLVAAVHPAEPNIA